MKRLFSRTLPASFPSSLATLLIAICLAVIHINFQSLHAATINARTLDSAGDTGQHTSQAIVAGNPAICYFDVTNGDLKYIRALDAAGATWGLPATPDAAGISGISPSLAVVDGNPAICYTNQTSGSLTYVRALDPVGTNWGTPVTIATTGDNQHYGSLAVVNGRPAVSYHTNFKLRYVQALDANGAAWGTSVTLDSDGLTGFYTSLALVNGHPAIAYHRFDHSLKYVRALDADGASWASPLFLISGGNAGAYPSLAVVDGNPAISYRDKGYRLGYIRALDASGTTWSTPSNPDPVAFALSTSLAVVDGNPVIGYWDAQKADLKCVRALDTTGSNWDQPATLDSTDRVGRDVSLKAVDGKAAFSYYDETNGDLKWATYVPTAAVPDVAVTQVGPLTDNVGSVDFGAVAVGGSSQLTFTITNSGAAELTGLDLTGATGEFSVSPLSETTIPVGDGSVTFSVTFTPAGPGARAATLQITSNDPDEHPFDILLTGAGAQAGSSSVLSNHFTGNSGAVPADWSDIGGDTNPASTIVESGTTVTITDTRGAGGPQFVLSPLFDAAGFTVAANLAAITSVSGSEPEVILGIGSLATGEVLMLSFKSATKIFSITKMNMGVVSGFLQLPSAPHLPSYTGGPLYYVLSAGATSFRVTSTNDNYDSGEIPYSALGAAGFDSLNDLGTTFGMILGVEAGGSVPEGTLASAAFDRVQIFALPVPTGAPEIALEEGKPVPDNGDKSFGEVNVGESADMTFTVKNTGTAALTLDTITIDGAGAGDYAVSTPPGSPVAAGGSTSFTLTFTPSAEGSRKASLHLPNNDADENPYDISITGTGVISAPEIEVEYPTGTSVADGELTINLGTVQIGGTPGHAEFIIRNTGTSPLVFDSTTTTGTGSFYFSIDTSELPPGESRTAIVETDYFMNRPGPHELTLHLNSNDADEASFEIHLVANAVPMNPEIVVEQGGGGLEDGVASVNFGSVAEGASGTPVTFTITNEGTADLTLGSFAKGGDHPDDFAISGPGMTTLPSGNSTTFTVTFSPLAAGVRTTVLRIPSNDANENPFDIALTGIGFTPPPVNLTVDEAGDTDDGDHSEGHLSLREAIKLANIVNDANAITFAAALNGSAIELSSALPAIAGPVTITGNGAQSTVVDAKQKARIFTIDDGKSFQRVEVTLAGMTIRNGLTSAVGTYSNSGGGILCEENLTIRECAITGNTVPGPNTFGGGIVAAGDLLIEDSLIAGNSCVGFMGGVVVLGTATLRNVTISGNSAPGIGGIAAYNPPSNLTLINCTIANNTGLTDPGIPLGGLTAVGGTIKLYNTIVAGNVENGVAADVATFNSGTVSAAENNLIGAPAPTGGITHGQNGNIVGNGAGGALPVANIITALADNGGPTLTHALPINSPAINTGGNTATGGLTNDQRGTGFPRIFAERVDIGAFESAVAADIVLEEPEGSDLGEGTAHSDFGAFEVGQASAPRTYTLKNVGDGALLLGAFIKGGPNPDAFTLSAPASTTLMPGESTTFTATFTPAAFDLHHAEVKISTNDPNESPYYLNLYGTGVLSPNADLSALTLSTGPLIPGFSSAVTTYRMIVPTSHTGLTITPTAVHTGATIQVNGVPLASGATTGELPLKAGINTFTILVTAEDGSSTKTYTVTVKRTTANETVIAGGAGSNRFGEKVTVLPNGNMVVCDSSYLLDGKSVGAVHLIDGATLSIISTLTGSTDGDSVGAEPIVLLTNGNYLVVSSGWSNGPVRFAGAVTWCSATTGVNGPISAANSLVGITRPDAVSLRVEALTNGNYVVTFSGYEKGGVKVGAVTWGNGTTGTTGVPSEANSLVGETEGDFSFVNIVPLPNGNYVVASSAWGTDDVGAATLCDGAAGSTVGSVTAANSLVGTAPFDSVGSYVVALANGNYVVGSSWWNKPGGPSAVGAVTWCSGTVPTTGPVTANNSLIGVSEQDSVGYMIFPLTNGNYVVSSPLWNKPGGAQSAGAVTWCHGGKPTVGVVSESNSLIGTTESDLVGFGNPGYSVSGVTALANGNYVVSSPRWNAPGGAASAGAVTWGNGFTGGPVGPVSAANSLTGSTDGDLVGFFGIVSLTNGNYVVCTAEWDNPAGPIADVGAATWCRGTAPTTGPITAANSLIGGNEGDFVGGFGFSLANGNYVISSAYWDNPSGPVKDAGAATWGDGVNGTTGLVSVSNSLVGGSADDNVGNGGPLPNGNYLIVSPNWRNPSGPTPGAGALTLGNGSGGTTGVITAANSVVGETAFERLGAFRSEPGFPINGFVGLSRGWDNPSGPVNNAGLLFYGDGVVAETGSVSATNLHLLGTTPSEFYDLSIFLDPVHSRIVAGSRTTNFLSLLPVPPVAPAEISLSQAGSSLSNGGSVSFGSTSVTSTQTLAFTITNTGAGPLGKFAITQVGADAADFQVINLPRSLVLAPGASTTFDLGFAPLSAGAKTATFKLASNDSDESIFNIVVTGTGTVEPEIAVEQPAGTELTHGGTTDLGGVIFGAGSSTSMTFTIANRGGAPLNLGAITKDGADADDFAVSAPASSTLAPGGTTTFTVTFTPGALGARTAAIHIASDDADESPFDITLTGKGTAPGTLAIGSASLQVFEELGTISVPIVRTGGSDGTVSVRISTINGTAKAPADFPALTNHLITLADGETSKDIPVAIVADALTSETNEIFSVQLSSPSGGASLGPVATATIRILEPDTAKPTVGITTPTLNASVTEGAATTVTGNVNDNKGVAKVEVSLNEGPWEEATLNLAANGLSGTYSLPYSPVSGPNTLKARSYDLRGNVSTEVSRPFTYVILRPLVINIVPANSGTCAVTPALTSGKAKLGVTYTLKVTPKTGFLWDEWTAPGVTSPASESTSLTLTMTEDLAVTANFIPKSAATNVVVVGTFTGLATPDSGTTPSQNNLGLFKGTTTATGSFSGSVNFAGTTTSLVAAFNTTSGIASGSNATLSWDLEFDTSGSAAKITGTVTQIASGDVCKVDADHATFSATAKVPDRFLKPGDNTKNGFYTVVFPPAESQSGDLTTSDYPQGYGIGTITVSPAGVVSLLGATLADGTTVTASAPLSKTFAWPMAVLIKSTATVTGLTLGGMVQFDTSQTDSDVTGADLRWFRPAKATLTHYPSGWPAGIITSLTGAHYTTPAGGNATPFLGDPSAEGNALLEFSGGLLEEPIAKAVNVSTKSAVTKVDTKDTSFTFTSITAHTATANGSFKHPLKPTAATSFKSIVLQKGANAGAWGFFLSPVPPDGSGESGPVTLLAPE